MPEDKESPLELARQSLLITQAIIQATNDPHRLVDIVAGASDSADALERVQSEFGFSEVQATFVLDAQFRRLSRSDRDRLAQMLADGVANLAALTEGTNNKA